MKPYLLFFICAAIAVAGFPMKLADANDTTYHFGFIKSKHGALPSIEEEGFKEILKKHGAIFLGDTTKKEVYLTFNNGYENGNTVKILDILKEKRVPAAFFITGYYVQYQPDLLKRMVQEGHILANHSWGHPDMSEISNSGLRDELDKLKNGVSKLTEQKVMRYMRPPSGIFNERVLRVGKVLGYTNVFWSIAYKDWDPQAEKGWKYAYDNVMDQLHPGAVIMLHCVSRDNVGALGKIIDDARNRGYEFKTLDQLTSKNVIAVEKGSVTGIRRMEYD